MERGKERVRESGGGEEGEREEGWEGGGEVQTVKCGQQFLLSLLKPVSHGPLSHLVSFSSMAKALTVRTLLRASLATPVAYGNLEKVYVFMHCTHGQTHQYGPY